MLKSRKMAIHFTTDTKPWCSDVSLATG